MDIIVTPIALARKSKRTLLQTPVSQMKLDAIPEIENTPGKISKTPQKAVPNSPIATENVSKSDVVISEPMTGVELPDSTENTAELDLSKAYTTPAVAAARKTRGRAMSETPKSQIKLDVASETTPLSSARKLRKPIESVVEEPSTSTRKFGATPKRLEMAPKVEDAPPVEIQITSTSTDVSANTDNSSSQIKSSPNTSTRKSLRTAFDQTPSAPARATRRSQSLSESPLAVPITSPMSSPSTISPVKTPVKTTNELIFNESSNESCLQRDFAEIYAEEESVAKDEIQTIDLSETCASANDSMCSENGAVSEPEYHEQNVTPARISCIEIQDTPRPVFAVPKQPPIHISTPRPRFVPERESVIFVDCKTPERAVRSSIIVIEDTPVAKSAPRLSSFVYEPDNTVDESVIEAIDNMPEASNLNQFMTPPKAARKTECPKSVPANRHLKVRDTFEAELRKGAIEAELKNMDANPTVIEAFEFKTPQLPARRTPRTPRTVASVKDLRNKSLSAEFEKEVQNGK